MMGATPRPPGTTSIRSQRQSESKPALEDGSCGEKTKRNVNGAKTSGTVRRRSQAVCRYSTDGYLLQPREQTAISFAV
jgi:hypothetical protein